MNPRHLPRFVIAPVALAAAAVVGFGPSAGAVEAACGQPGTPAVYETVVFGVADEKWGERVEAAVQLKPGAMAEPAELAAFVKERLGSVKAPKIVHLVEDLPRNHLGKVLRREVKARFDRPDRRLAG